MSEHHKLDADADARPAKIWLHLETGVYQVTGTAPELKQKLHVTFFKDEFAKTLTTDTLTLDQLRERVLNASKRKKGKLPWLKLAKFGNKRSSDGDSLRFDDNVEAISGIEIDYDGEKISFGDALQALQALQVAALIYTSPSHSEAAPRWRVLCPTAGMLAPELRSKLVRRLNGYLKAKLDADKVAARESFALSQSYYFGWVCDAPKPDHKAEIVNGSFIDQRDDLASFEANGGPPEEPAAGGDRSRPGTGTQYQDHGFAAILAKIGDGDELLGFNGPLSRAASSYVVLHDGHPFDREKLKALLRRAIEDAPKKESRKASEIKRYLSDRYLNGVIASAERKYVRPHPITLQDFVAVMSSGSYLFIPTREMWPAKSVNACISPIPVKRKDGSLVLSKKAKQPILTAPSEWLDEHQRVEQITWAPGKLEIIRDLLVADGGWIERPGVSIFNLYRPPIIATADSIGPVDVRPWFNHMRTIYPDDWLHIVPWLAHRVQRPEEKINHAILLGGSQGIGKDTILEPVKHAVGPWNFSEISPIAMLGRFNGFLRAVILRISEARDLGEVNRFSFYDHLKTVTAAPPDVLRVDEKNLREHYIFNVCGVIITSNYKTGGVYLPPDDRRTYVAWSNFEKEAFTEDYWKTIWRWYADENGTAKVAAFLKSFDLSAFNPKAPPPRTPAFYEIVASGVAPEEIELGDLIERMGNPDAVTLAQLSDRANTEIGFDDLARWIDDRDNRKALPHRLELVGYVRVPNPDNVKQGIWNIKTWHARSGQIASQLITQRQHAYAKASLAYNDQIRAVRAMIDAMEQAAETEEAKAKAAEAKQKAEEAARNRTFDFNRN